MEFTKKVILGLCFFYLSNFSIAQIENNVTLLCEEVIDENGCILIDSNKVTFGFYLDSSEVIVKSYDIDFQNLISYEVVDVHMKEADFKNFFINRKHYFVLDSLNYKAFMYNDFDDSVLKKKNGFDYLCCYDFGRYFIFEKEQKTGKSTLIIKKCDSKQVISVLNDIQFKAANDLLISDINLDGIPEIIILTYSEGIGRSVIYCSLFSMKSI